MSLSPSFFNIGLAVLMLIVSNLFMTFAWYGHLKTAKDSFWFYAVLVSWGIAFFEYLIQVPANRIGYQSLSVAQLKIIQEVITLGVFVPFSIFFLDEKPKTGYYLAAVCMMAAVYFIFWFDE